MGTTEPMNTEDSIEKRILIIHWVGWRNEPGTNSFIGINYELTRQLK